MASPTEHGGAGQDSTAIAATAFGLSLRVEDGIEVPGLESEDAVDADRGGSPVRVRVAGDELQQRWEQAEEPQRMRELSDGRSTLLTVDLVEPAGYLLDAAGVGRVLVSPDGREVICDPDPERSDWAFILSAQALPLAATLRGFEVFHAAGVVVNGGAALFAGTPGAGKSSLAAAFLRRGAQLLGDDAIATELAGDSLRAHPAVAALYLREAEDERLGDEDRAALGSSQAFASRRRYSATLAAEPAPVAGLYLLERAESGEEIERLEAVDPFELLAATFNLSVRTPERLLRQLDVATALSKGGDVYRLRVLPGVDADQLAESVETHILETAR